MEMDIEAERRARAWQIEKMELASRLDFEREERERIRKLDEIDNKLRQLDKEKEQGKTMSINLNNLDEEQRNKIQNLANLQQTYEIINSQKNQTESHLRETEFALEELEKISDDNPVYKSIGGILVKSDRDKLLDEKKSLKVTLEMRLKTLDQKKSRLENQITTLSNSIQADLQNKSA